MNERTNEHYPKAHNTATKIMMESEEFDLPTENIVDDGSMTLVLVGLEKKNKEAVVILNKYGHDGDQLLKTTMTGSQEGRSCCYLFSYS